MIGSCHCGLFAGAACYGFYAAHTEAIAAVCQTSLLVIEALEGKTELSTLKHNIVTALNYPLNLAILARRALYKEQNMSVAKELVTCENRDILGLIE